MISYAELEQFYEGLVVKLRDRGVVCAITSGMACVSYGVAQTTKDCDMHAGRLLAVNPMCDFGLDRLITEARTEALKYAPPGSLDWLPDVRGSFIGLGE